ncbi:MAG: ADP compounds hydrolase NudE [Xanthomonadales bacterium]|nr:ADP compounds hydrolase NudE [Gammaproteobacteria bacterium]MBT8074160.1 ADP compounds hydrolase NudE [Gammaproteobacteria bacterium]MBT8076749.1 ADP compounds hydrolase NudE [Gammaproteobacteria bacterium]NNK05013.1 ADP compounds hydrolase NudE [Xanthomonadales bacterium]NNL00202.1 ADP compounds hydrolase NudE [Xanthomonadales bacterium]
MPTLPKIHARLKRDAGKRFKVERLDLEFSNGEKRTYERLLTHGLGAVIVVAMRDDETVLLVREYAAGLHHYELGLVKGRLEPGESVLEGAQRELKEEIGLGAKRLMQLTSLSLAPGYMTHVTHVVLARDLYPEKLQGDEPEELEIVPWPLDDLHSLVQRPDCTEGRSIAALYIARDHLQQETTDVE